MLPCKKAAWEEEEGKSILQQVASNGKGQRMRMAFEYLVLTKHFTINRFPPRWCYPVTLLFEWYLREVQVPYFTPFVCEKFEARERFGEGSECWAEIVRGKEYGTQLPKVQRMTAKDE